MSIPHLNITFDNYAANVSFSYFIDFIEKVINKTIKFYFFPWNQIFTSQDEEMCCDYWIFLSFLSHMETVISQ